jgi:GNAT superfamily N-acetyltransferase
MGKTGLKDSFFINLIGIDPARQGHRLGSALMETAVKLADDLGVEMMLDTQEKRTVGWYQSFGFEIRDQAEIDVKGEAVTSWGMVRPAQS